MQIFMILFSISLITLVVFSLNKVKRFLGTIIMSIIILIVLIQALFFDEFGWMMILFVIVGIVFGTATIIGTAISEVIRYQKRKKVRA
jgi:hypothetical protein